MAKKILYITTNKHNILCNLKYKTLIMRGYSYIFTKYRFKGLPLLVLSDDGVFYRLPFESNKRFYDLKELRVHYHNGKNKLLYNKKRYTKEKLNMIKYNHKELIKTDRDKFNYVNNDSLIQLI